MFLLIEMYIHNNLEDIYEKKKIFYYNVHVYAMKRDNKYVINGIQKDALSILYHFYLI